MKREILISWILFVFAGCATQRYGRMIDVVESEADNLDCNQIEIEIDKCNAFIRDVNTRNKKFTGKDIISFLGDFGIGDSWEVTDAIDSATRRTAQLEKLRSEKKCGSQSAGKIGYRAERDPKTGKIETFPVYENKK